MIYPSGKQKHALTQELGLVGNFCFARLADPPAPAEEVVIIFTNGLRPSVQNTKMRLSLASGPENK